MTGGSFIDFLSMKCNIIVASKVKLRTHAALVLLGEVIFDSVIPGYVSWGWRSSWAFIQLCGSVDVEAAKYGVRKLLHDLLD